ncbi:Gfo/Idh/MocA family oxidoreductase [Kluyvera cryocrescens]|uniref:Gfo/Idh/MocA family protein n=1 Tax=Kluyvera cryocrescens TaxID=580 RepID=UPI00224A60A6|nr:Gfo/Idh/MocA family oxidoreductase [Kluyvera cryocrescens]MCX2868982.1 Gfo/Idh/MocA family oxidoreductase [Kluyvera cryocrescens]
MKTRQAAIIGAGAIHTCHVEALSHVPDVALRALVDIDSDKGSRLAAGYGCQFYQDYREMLLDDAVDVVHICTPHHQHKPMILAALAAGKQVFCEKPMVMTPLDVAEIKSAAAIAQRHVGICYQNRLNPTSLAIARCIEENALGPIRAIKAVLTWSRSGGYYAASPWRGRFATEGGSLLINQAIHTLDLMQWFGQGVSRLKGVVDSTLLADEIDTEDSAMAAMCFNNGARGLFYASNCHASDSPLLLELEFERGLLRLTDNELWQLCGDDRVKLASDASPDGVGKSYWGIGHQQAIRQFYRALDNHPEGHYCGITEAAKSLQMVNAIYQSSLLRKWVHITE